MKGYTHRDHYSHARLTESACTSEDHDDERTARGREGTRGSATQNDVQCVCDSGTDSHRDSVSNHCVCRDAAVPEYKLVCISESNKNKKRRGKTERRRRATAKSRDAESKCSKDSKSKVLSVLRKGSRDEVTTVVADEHRHMKPQQIPPASIREKRSIHTCQSFSA